MKAIEFKEIWQHYVETLQRETDWLALWNSDSKWTDEVQNNVRMNSWHWSNKLKSALAEEYVSESIQMTPEYRKIDFVAARPIQATIQTMGEDELTINETVPTALEYGFLDFVIEFENSIAACYQEMIKLTQIRAKLKVLITYDYDHQGKPEPYWVDTAVQNWKGIINEAQDRLPEPGVEYLFIIGQLSNTDSDPVLSWSYFDETAELLN